jgi:signal transduction histidine kinase
VFVDHLQAQPAPSQATAPTAAAYHSLWADRGTDPVAVWAPLVERGQVVGLLGLGPRWTGEVYDDQDLQLIGILARQMALSILNTRQLERLQDMARLIVQAEENERLKIARELHDTILQFLLLLTYGLDDVKEQQRGLAHEIEQWQDRISAESSRLRDLLSYLRAPEVLVQQGLVPSLQAWIAQMSRRADVSIQAELSPAAEKALAVEAQVAIYRVFREAVHNALKHSGGNRIVVRLWREGEWVRFSIADNGRGFDAAQAWGGSSKGYSSLQDMRTHVENVGGRLNIQSAPGEGACVEGRVPVARSE